MFRLFVYLAAFGAGWLFNFVFDVRFALGFASGWLAHTWLGPIIDQILRLAN